MTSARPREERWALRHDCNFLNHLGLLGLTPRYEAVAPPSAPPQTERPHDRAAYARLRRMKLA